MNNRKLFICILASLGLFAGCSDDSASNSSLLPGGNLVKGGSCTVENAKVCNPSAAEVLVCVNGIWDSSQVCGDNQICENSACKDSGSSTSVCTPETADSFRPVCNGNESTICTKDGEKVTTKCADGFICKDGYCTNSETCDSTYEPRCQGESMLHCVKGVVVYEDCGEGKFCSGGVCIEKKPCDVSSMPECQGAGYQVCKGGFWHYEKCDEGSYCDEEKGTCVKGACTPGVKYCSPDNKSAFQCVGGKLEETFCEGATCADGECHDPEYCETDKYKSECVDGQLKHCVSGKVVTENCPGTLECYNGACVSDGPCDQTMTPVCLSTSQVQTCGETGNKVTTSCKDGEVCLNGICQVPDEACTDGVKECLNANVYHNCVDGKWVSGYCNVASEVCIAGDCMSNTAVESCNILQKDACDTDGLSVIKCENGYKVKYACGEDRICVDGACTDKEQPKPDDPCDVATFKLTCLDDGNTLACVDGKVVSIPCGEDKICKDGACVDKTCDPNTFVAECKGDFEITVCVDGKLGKESCGENKHCSNGACVDDANVDDPCHPETFAATCTTEGKILTCDGETHKVKATECTGSTPVCLNGSCVACDPAKYESNCTDGHKYSCESNGNLKDTLCKDGNVCFNGDCAECDPTKTAKTCVDGKVHVCNSNGIFEDSACPEGYSCANGECTNKCKTNSDCNNAHYVCDNGECKFQAECVIGKQECDGTNGVKVCKAPGLWEKSLCSDGQVCRGEGICMGNECDPETYGTKCKNDKTPTICVNGYIKEQAECAGICLNGACAECDSTTTAPSCNGEPTAYYCIDNKYKQVTCTQPQEYCSPGDGCISVCGKDYKPSCNSKGQLVTCDYQNRKLKTEDCSFDSECVNGVCEKIVGKSCIPAAYTNKCHDVTGVTYVEYCDKSTQKVVVASCNNSDQFCGTVNGETDCFSTCSEAQLAQNLTWCSTWWDKRQYIGKCFEGKDYKGSKKYGILRQSGLCIDNMSISCREDKTAGHNNHVVFDYVTCDMMGSTCSNGSCGFASCGSLSATCDGNVAKNCMFDPTYDSGVGGNVYYQMNCNTLGGTCRVLDYDGVTKAICDKSEGNFTGIGTVSTLGTCSNGALHTLYFGNATGTSFGAHSLQCHSQCVTETKNGATYSYCK
ncbi:MAG: hypothetical protein IJU23_07500 [Proteobacteria bacterium]|nr:hypothetical protein [Pseudomonadota bacterium]